MRATRTGVLLGAIVMIGYLPNIRAQDTEAARVFITQLYQKYSVDKDFSPFFNPKVVRTLATPSLADLVEQEMKISAAAGDQSELDYDPVSGSQDYEGLRLTSLKVTPEQPGRMLVTATLRIQKETVVRRFLLVSVKGAWRIDNIAEADGRNDLRTILTKSVAAHGSRQKH